MEIERRLTIPLLSCAQQLEDLIGDRMRPYDKGLYIPINSSPIILPHQQYIQYARDGSVVKVIGQQLLDNRNLIIGDIFTDKDELVLPYRARALLADKPYLPHRAFLLIQNLIERQLQNHFMLTKIKNTGVIDIIRNHLVPGSFPAACDMTEHQDNELDKIYDEVMRIIHPVQSMIDDFMGNDHYKVHLQVLHGEEVSIEKTIDYRIHVYNEKVKSGEWSD